MRDSLADHLTTWRWWYALIALPAVVVGSLVASVGAFVGGGEPDGTLAALLTPLSMLAFAAFALGMVALFARRWPSNRDLGLRRGLSRHDLVVLAVVFVLTHVIFWLLSLGSGETPKEQAKG